MKKIVGSIILLCVFCSLFLVSCGTENKTDMLFIGESEKWQVKFEVMPISTFDKDDHSFITYIETLYLGDYTDIKGINDIKYEYRWIHQDFEFVSEEDLNIKLSSPSIHTPVTVSIGQGRIIYREENCKVFYARSTINQDISNFADYIRLNLKWNGHEEMIEIKINNND
ncbi:hypothetical protein SYNTR_0200 [Candidatus Syntrophocurvum alkaliphilum]|uniref:Lipoprotein n=1 Tax=Candidatus Syntrophocurvum alkaliphilum TaxID=2293317 RepID=A0A6I6D6A3_9FIRM|nr:hypothetical protein [Candidatus Syntrophocurvum alkaliphilum]QGT98793.1 hypothetical protein SYNTR_0200 [Candidatus Syntrophocurvum alkaliphilum]